MLASRFFVFAVQVAVSRSLIRYSRKFYLGSDETGTFFFCDVIGQVTVNKPADTDTISMRIFVVLGVLISA